MLVLRQHRIYRSDLRANPRVLYIFGDNLDREGMGGQAKEMRGEPNAFGIATKRKISHGYPEDYFHDGEPDTIEVLKGEFWALQKKVRNDYFVIQNDRKVTTHDSDYNYDAIVIPSDGIGTGLSKMPQYAPQALEFINERLKELENW